SAASVGLDLGAELYCLSCEEGLQHGTSIDSSQLDGSNLSDRSLGGSSERKRRNVDKASGVADPTPKLYSCSLCTFTSRYSNHLKRHMRTHDGQKPYRCPVCPYASAQLVNLQRHARTHTGEKPYRCHQCSYACSSLGNLKHGHNTDSWDKHAPINGLGWGVLSHLFNRAREITVCVCVCVCVMYTLVSSSWS
uniref:C2H2-type domain-containing protein n=1 Tax=Neolamprologus brichardi TaxID=32507 RepID=A0A3Q4HZP0_NEOBR